MNSAFLRRSVAATALAAALVSSPAAHAQAVRDKVIELMRAELTAIKAKNIKFTNVSGDDAKFTIEEITAILPEAGKELSLTVANSIFVGAKPNENGSYSADEISMRSIDIEGDMVVLSFGATRLVNYSGISEEKRATGRMETFDRLEMADIEVSDADKVTIPITSVVMTASGHVDGIPRKSSLEMKGMTIPVEAMAEDGKQLAELGYKEVSLDVAVAGAWDEAAARLTVDTLSLEGKDMGGLKLGFVLGAVTADAVKALQAAQDDSTKVTEILQGFTFESLAIRFDNASIVDRVLDFQAKQAGTKREQYVAGIAAAVPLLIQAINNKPFEKRVGDAVSAFLKAPKSLAVSAKPAQPIPVAQILGTAMVAPQSLPNVLGVDIEANK